MSFFKESSYKSEQLFLDIPIIPRYDIVKEAPTHVAIPRTPLVHTHTEQGSVERLQESPNSPHTPGHTELGSEEMMQEQVALTYGSSIAESQPGQLLILQNNCQLFLLKKNMLERLLGHQGHLFGFKIMSPKGGELELLAASIIYLISSATLFLLNTKVSCQRSP